MIRTALSQHYMWENIKFFLVCDDSDIPSMETFLLGLVSLCLTILNIICIIITGILILRLKVGILTFWRGRIFVTQVVCGGGALIDIEFFESSHKILEVNIHIHKMPLTLLKMLLILDRFLYNKMPHEILRLSFLNSHSKPSIWDVATVQVFFWCVITK